LWFARLHFITPRQSSPLGLLGCAAAIRGRLAEAKKIRHVGFFEDWRSIDA